ncbi:hypothetical protein CEXT_130481 [Caerostris extrusa]|uniref:Uncharacterized protein n=1 Tax=Caerostris extrusa TaxID=172846 RepID=A0AAV4NVP5_CAEEX|nr:hypothetical protein CEXT_130481 [Caerostris extrusa]
MSSLVKFEAIRPVFILWWYLLPLGSRKKVPAPSLIEFVRGSIGVCYCKSGVCYYLVRSYLWYEGLLFENVGVFFFKQGCNSFKPNLVSLGDFLGKRVY